MTTQEIKQHKAWAYIGSLSNTERYSALFGNKSQVENGFNCTIEERPFTYLSKLTDDDVFISVTDPFRNIAFIAVLVPKS